MEIPNYGIYAKESWPSQEKGFAAMVTRMDSDVGRIIAKVKAEGLENAQLIVGMTHGERNIKEAGTRYSAGAVKGWADAAKATEARKVRRFISIS